MAPKVREPRHSPVAQFGIPLDGKWTAEEFALREAELENMALQAAFTKTIERGLKENEFTAEQQAEVIHWIGTRAFPLLQLADEEKLKSPADNDSESA